MDQDAREVAKQEIEALEDFIEDKRVAQQGLLAEADKESSRIADLEEELAELRAEDEHA